MFRGGGVNIIQYHLKLTGRGKNLCQQIIPGELTVTAQSRMGWIPFQLLMSTICRMRLWRLRPSWDVNDLQDAVVAIETELGTNPKGGYANVGAAIADKLSTTGGTITGNVTCSAGVTIDGVDISAHDHSGGTKGVEIPEIAEVRDAREDEDNLLENLARRGADWVHDAVNESSLDANGFPDYLSAGTGLAVDVDGSTSEIVMDICGYFQFIDSDTSISGLTASTTNYLYAEKAESGFEPDLGFTTLKPVYSYQEPSSPSTDQHWYDLARGVMKRWTGSEWEEVERIFIGEAETDASSVTDVVAYTLKGRYDSGWFAVSANTKYEKDHCLGCIPLDIELLGATDSDGANCHKVGYYDDGSNCYGGMVWDIDETMLNINDDTSGFDYPIRYGASTSSTSGYYRFIARRGW